MIYDLRLKIFDLAENPKSAIADRQSQIFNHFFFDLQLANCTEASVQTANLINDLRLKIEDF